MRYVLEADFAFIADHQIEPRSDLAKCVLGEADRARLGDAFQSRGDIDAVAHQVAVGLLDDVAEMDADTKFNAALGRHAGVSLDHGVLHFDGAAHGVDHGTELDERAVSRSLDDPAAVDLDRRVDEIAAQGAEAGERPVLVGARQSAESDDVGGQNGRKFPAFGHSPTPMRKGGAFLLAAPDASTIHGRRMAIHS